MKINRKYDGKKSAALISPEDLAEILGMTGGRVIQVMYFPLDNKIGVCAEFPPEDDKSK